MKFSSKHIIFLLLLILSQSTYAFHIIGGEIFYEHISDNKYRITLKVYRDCNSGGAPFDDPAHLAVYSNSGQLLQEFEMNFTSSTNVPIVINSPCLVAPPNLCVEFTIYTKIIDVGNIGAGGIYIVYQRCCRNSTILNISNPADVGSTYLTKINPPSIVVDNSSPSFNILPPLVICTGEPLVVNSSATDLDGDSLVYELCTPYSGGTSTFPMPIPPDPPPYDFVDFVPPYGVNNMLGGNPAMSINPVTGILTAYPVDIGQFVAGICVKEYRNGVLIGENRRDFQFNVVNCNPTVKAIFNPTTVSQPLGIDSVVVCGQLNVAFSNTSINDNLRKWDFGDLTTTSDTSTQKNPTYIFLGVGVYKVTLIVNPGSNCSDTTYKYIVLREGVEAYFPDVVACQKTPISFIDSSIAFDGTINNWFWEYSDGNTSINQNPTHIFTTSGTKEIKLSVKSNLGCKDDFTRTIVINPIPVVSAKPDTTICYRDSVIISASSFINYSWAPSYELNETNIQSPIASPNISTTYTVTVVNEFNCIGKDSVLINVVDTVISVAGPDTTICEGESVSLSSNSGVYFLWWSDENIINASLNPQIVAPTSDATYYVYSFIGSCYDFDSVKVRVLPLPDVQCIESSTINQGEQTQLNVVGADSYQWTPYTTLSQSNIADPFAFPLNTTTYTVVGFAPNGCRAIDSVIVIVTHNHLLFVPNAFTPNGDGINDDFRFYSKGIRKIISVSIYNRFGERIYEAPGTERKWDGTYKNKEQEIGVYVYVIQAETYDGNILVEKGNVTLMR